MRVEVDQSIKIERSGATILAFANGISYAILIPAPVKVEGIRILRRRNKSAEAARLMIFSACLYLLIEKHLTQLTRVLIDTEYSGKEADIKIFLLRYIWKKYPTFDESKIGFGQIGKVSPAHQKARNVRLGKDAEDRKITLKELLNVIE